MADPAAPGGKPEPVELGFDALRINPTALRFDGERAGVGISMFVVRTPPGRFVELHTHPYAETFVLLEGHARWTVGESVYELDGEGLIVAPAAAPHGFRNIGEVPLLVVSVHEAPAIEQTWLGVEPH